MLVPVSKVAVKIKWVGILEMQPQRQSQSDINSFQKSLEDASR